MAEYGKKTVAELTEILKSRGLPHSGKKAELIARLNENDKQAESQPEPATETDSAVAAPATEPVAAPVQEPVVETTSTATTNPAPTADLEGAGEEPAAAAAANYTLNLKASDLDSELAKRKARAERFGTSAVTATEGQADADSSSNTVESEALKNLERAKRFGTENTAISKLDEALPSERVRGSNKRKAAEDASSAVLDDPGLRRGFANRNGRGGRHNRGRGGGGGNNRNAGGNARGPQGISKAPAYTSDKDRLAAEARKKKFATA